MLRFAMSPAAAALVRALVARAGVARDRILLTELESVEWQSLTFAGERHEIRLRVPGPGAGEIAERLTGGLADAEFDIPGQIVADVTLRGAPAEDSDGSVSLIVEALTIAE